MKQLLLVVFSFLVCTMAWGQDPELVRKAEAGDIKAQGKLASNYWLKDDFNKAAQWAKPAAEAGDARAQDVLANLYMYGEGGLPKNKELAFKWAHKSAAQGHWPAMFGLGLWNEDTNEKEAIYWFKKSMDTHYQKNGFEDEMAAKHLRDLGVTYHPGSSSYTASRSSSSSGSSSSSSSSSSGLLYSGLYTKSSQGYWEERGMYTDPLPNDFEVSVEIYDDHIVVLNSRYDYVKTSNGWKIYGGEVDFLGNVEYYKVNPSNYEMSYSCVTSNPYMGGISTMTYAMKKGSTTFQKVANSGQGNGYNSNSGSYSSGSSGNTKTRHTCPLCNGQKRIVKDTYPSLYGGKNYQVRCNECGGYFMRSTGHTHVTCPQCHGRGYSEY